MSDAIRVLALSDHLGHPGGRIHGATTYYLSVFPALRAAGVDLTACFMNGWHPAADQLEAAGITPIFLGRNRWDARALADVLRLMAERDTQVLHLAGFKGHFLGRVAGVIRHRPALIHLHDTVPLPPLIRIAQRSLARYTAVAIAVSDAVAEFGVAQYAIPRSKVRTLHNALDLDRFGLVDPTARGSVRDELGLPRSASLIGLIGRLAAMKGHAYMIEAMPAVLERCPGAVLMICGVGELETDCRDLVRRHGVERSVVFAGQRSDIPRVLAALDVLAIPSMFGEGLPYVAIESIASGTPVVAFPTAGIPDVVPDGKAGLLVPSGDTAALGAAVTRVLLDPDLRRRLGEGAREHALGFGLARHVDRLLALYRSALDAPAAPFNGSDTASPAAPDDAASSTAPGPDRTDPRRAGAP